ncbi:MAG: GNAT family N-acetyltransferase, partial [Syntrophomonadaceae bacterium]|nr:GNAT family N-acetyltransferase [Syntrophomonadaceae bacterium]
MIVLTTKNLILRPFRPEDAADVYRYSQSPNVGPNAGWKPHESLEESRRIMGEIFLDQNSVWGITLKPDDRVIGSIGLLADAKRQNYSVMMLGYALDEQYWGRGIAMEAARAVIKYGFEELDLTMI